MHVRTSAQGTITRAGDKPPGFPCTGYTFAQQPLLQRNAPSLTRLVAGSMDLRCSETALHAESWMDIVSIQKVLLLPHETGYAVQPNERFRDLLIIENMVTLNSAFCHRHLGHCPPSAELGSECAQVRTTNHNDWRSCSLQPFRQECNNAEIESWCLCSSIAVGWRLRSSFSLSMQRPSVRCSVQCLRVTSGTREVTQTAGGSSGRRLGASAGGVFCAGRTMPRL